jgi:acetyl-CoA synthetase
MDPLPRPSAPNLDDYDRVPSTFTWDAARAELDSLPRGGGLNIAHEAVDRHAHGPRGDRIAIRWLGKRGEIRAYTYRDLGGLTSRFANVLASLGLRRGDRVFALAGRVPELYVAALGTLKHGGVFCPMFSAFGPEPIRA